MAMWNQSKHRRLGDRRHHKGRRKPDTVGERGHAVSSVRPTASRLRRISALCPYRLWRRRRKPAPPLRFNIANPHSRVAARRPRSCDEGRIRGHCIRRSRGSGRTAASSRSSNRISRVSKEISGSFHASPGTCPAAGRAATRKSSGRDAPEANPTPASSGVRWPTMAGLAAAPGTAKAGKPHHDLAEKGRDRMVPVIFHSGTLATTSEVRPPDGWPLAWQRRSPVGTGQQQVPFGQGQPKFGISPRSSGRLIFKTS